MATARNMICDLLVDAGIDHVFGMPGGGVIPIFDALYDRQDKIRTVLVRHEQSAACMADMYGRLTGKPGVVLCQGLWAGCNAAFGIMEAYLASTPMVVITDTSDFNVFAQHGVYQCASGEYGSVDLREVFKGMSKFVSYATTGAEAVQGLQLAIKHATTGRMGPACLIIKSAAVGAEVNPQLPPRIRFSEGYYAVAPPAAREEDVSRVVELLTGADFPVMILGNGVHAAKAYEEVRALAELFGMAVVTSYKGKGTISEFHPLSLGTMGAWGGRKGAHQAVSSADVLLVIGCRLKPEDTRLESPQLIDPDRQKIVQIDIDSRNAGWNFPVQMGICADARVAASQILTAAQNRLALPFKRAAERGERVAATKENDPAMAHPFLTSDAVPIKPHRVLRELENAVPDDTITVFDAGNNRVFATHYYRAKRAGSLFVAGGAAGMGWGPPAAVGAKFVYPQRPVVCIAGDGGFAMTNNAVSTAVQYGLPVVFVVLNNSVLGFVRDFQVGRPIASEFVDTDFARIGEGWGAIGRRIEDPNDIRPAIEEALKGSRPTVLDIVTEATPIFEVASL